MANPSIGTTGRATITSRLAPVDLIERITGELSTVRGVRWSTSADQIVITSWETPWWAVVVAVVAFPIGLVAVVARRTVVGIVRCTATAEGTVVTCVGSLPCAVVDLVRELAAG